MLFVFHSQRNERRWKCPPLDYLFVFSSANTAPFQISRFPVYQLTRHPNIPTSRHPSIPAARHPDIPSVLWTSSNYTANRTRDTCAASVTSFVGHSFSASSIDDGVSLETVFCSQNGPLKSSFRFLGLLKFGNGALSRWHSWNSPQTAKHFVIVHPAADPSLPYAYSSFLFFLHDAWNKSNCESVSKHMGMPQNTWKNSIYWNGKLCVQMLLKH